MSFRVVFLGRDFSRASQPGMEFGVERMKWTIEGGADEAILRGMSRGREEDVNGLLRRPVVISNQLGRAVWWGFVNAVRVGSGGFEIRYTLDKMWNRVAVKFERDGLLNEDEYTSEWASDERSISEFGTKELLIVQKRYSEDLEAEAIRDRALAEYAWPKAEVIPGRGMKDGEVVLECKGWMHTMDWKCRQDISGYISNDVVQSGYQQIGYTLYIRKAAQAFDTLGAMNLKRVQLRIRKEAIPTDNLMVSIQADSGGNPSGTKLAEWTRAYSLFEDEGYRWMSFDLETAISLSGESRYWIVVERSGPPDDGWFYELACDIYSSYKSQSFKLYGSAWYLRKVNALFRVIGIKETSEQIEDVYGDCNQFLTGIEVKNGSGVMTQPFDREMVRGKERIGELMRMGTSNGLGLTAEVREDRKLIIREQEAEGENDFYVDEDGVYFDHLNNRLEEGVVPLGRWVKVKGLNEMPANLMSDVEWKR